MQALGKKINRFMHVKELATTGTPTIQGQKPNCTFLNPMVAKYLIQCLIREMLTDSSVVFAPAECGRGCRRGSRGLGGTAPGRLCRGG